MPNSLLQKSLRNFTCSHQGHGQQPLDYVCISTQCENEQRVMCYLCSLQNHVDHEKVAIKIFLKQVMAVQKKSQKVAPLCAQIDNIFHQILTKITKHSQEFSHPQLVIRTFQQYRNIQIQSLMDFYKLVQKTIQLFQEDNIKLIDRVNWFVKNIYSKYFSDIEPSEWSKVNMAEIVLGNKIQAMNSTLQMLEKLHVSHKFNDMQVLSLFPLVVQQERKVKVFFSEDLKPNNMTIVSPTQAKMTTSGSQRLLILEPCLSKTQTLKRWGVRIIKLASWIGVGVCHINAIKKSNYMFNYSNTGHGNYLISSNGYSWSSYKKEYNSKFEPFTYTTGDVIHLQYNPKEKIIKFKKQSDPNQPTYQLQIEANDDPVHPEINLTGVNDEVELINF